VSRRFILVGHPVSHSFSPAIHAAAYAELGIDARYELVDAPDEAAVRRAVAAVRSGEVAGANVTVPWKQLALELADRADASASDVGAANVLVRDSSAEVVAHNTDVPALAAELTRLAGSPGVAVVLGAGGAALAAVAAARRVGAEVRVSARRFDAAVPDAEWPNAAALRRLGAELLAWPRGMGAVLDAAVGAQVVLQATSAGMSGASSGAGVADVVPWSRLAPGAVAYDLVYNPSVTPFLERATAAGITASGGLGMLVGQAAFAFELWLGKEAPRSPMERAAQTALLGRQR
jgi:shikimate dehydrogenase